MTDFTPPQAESADICLLCEGTYPFLSGGVANWIGELIKFFPQYSFAVIFLGSSPEDYSTPFYEIPPNLVHIEICYLFRTDEPSVHTNEDLDKETFARIKSMHDKFVETLSDPNADIPEVFELMEENAKPDRATFLRSKSAWNFLTNRYYEHFSNESFFEYFWTIRSLHRPFWELKKVVNRVPKFKLLHSASTGYAGFLGALLQKKYSIPHVLTEHGIYTKERWIEIMRNFFFKQASQQNIRVIDEETMRSIWLRFFSVLAKIAYVQSNPIISLTAGYQQRQIADGALSDRTRIISYGIDFERFKFLDNNLNVKKPIVACIARVVPIKDVKTFIRACAIIIQRIPSVEAWVVGSTEEDPTYTETCRSLISTLGMDDKIKLLGVQNITETYRKIDLLILTSISEGSPFVMLECLAVGIPMVATDVGGCGELIHGKNKEDEALGPAGRLVQIANPLAVADAAIELISDETTWKNAQKAGLQRVRKYYSMETLVKSYGQIYEEAILHGRYRI